MSNSNKTIKLGLELNDNGSVNKVIKDVNTLRKEVDSLNTATAKTNTVARVAAAAYKAAAPTGALADANNNDRTAYNIARSGAGTGADARDFAKQAQGLGGLVHVYATFAANLFAVTAAFNALKQAADTTNLVDGLNQLGAASGKSLGNLAKQMVAAADGALSLRDAMTATALASSAGMSNANILRMTEVSRKASLALGRDMSDSMDRIVKGIAKIQPELLDELGIMARVIPAQEAYARQIGKTASSLTDFEKRQAFANAVLEEGERKFSAINLDSNPYAKILAAMQNIAHVGLELVNKVFSPILSALSQSPTALATAMAAVGAILLKQAIPALGSFKESLKDASDKATALANLRSLEAKKAALAEFTARKQLADNAAEHELAVFEAAAAKLESIKSVSTGKIKKTSKEAFDIINKPRLQDITDADLKRLDEFAEKKTKISSIYKELASGVRNYRLAEEAYNTEVQKGLLNLKAQEKWYTTISQLRAAAERDNQKAATREITSNAAQVASIRGVVAGWKALNEEIAVKRAGDTTKLVDTGTPLLKEIKTSSGKEYIKQFDEYGNLVTKMEEVTVGKMNAMRAGWTRLTGTLSLLTGAVGTAINAFGFWGQVIGLAVGAFQLLDAWVSSSRKEADAFALSTNTVTEAVDNAQRTLSVLANKEAGALKIDSIQAKATAFNELSSSIQTTTAKFIELQKNSNAWDKALDSIFDAFGSGAADALATSLAKSVTSSIRLMQEGPAKQAAKNKLRNILGDAVDTEDYKSIEKSLRTLTDSDIAEKGKIISASLAEISREANNSASNLTSLKGSFEATTKILQTSIADLSPKDVFGKTGAAFVNDSIKIRDAMNAGPIESLATLNELLKNTEIMSILPKDTNSQLQNAKKGIDEVTQKLEGVEKARIKAEEDIEALKASGKYVGTKIGVRGVFSKEGKALNETLAQLAKEREGLEQSAKDVTANFANLDKVVFATGISRLETSLKGALEEGGIAAAKGYLSVLKSVGGSTAAEEGALRAKEIDIQMSNIKATYSLIAAIQENTRAQTEKTAKDDIKEATEKLATATGDSIITKYTKQLKDAEEKLAVVLEEKRLFGSGAKGISTVMKQEADKSGSVSDITKIALQNLSPVIAQLYAMEGQLAKLVGAKAANELQTMAAVITESAASTKRALDQETARNNIEISTLSTTIAISKVYDETLQKRKDELEISNLLNTYVGEYAAANAKVLISEKLIAEASKNRAEKDLDNNSAYTAAIEAKRKAEVDLANIVTSNLSKLGILTRAQVIKNATGIEELRKLEAARAAKAMQDTEAITQAYINQQETTTNYLLNIGAITQKNADIALGALEIDKQKSIYAVQLNEIERKGLEEKNAAQITLNALLAANESLPPGVQKASTADAQAALDGVTVSVERQKLALELNNTAKLNSIKLDTEWKAMLAGQVEVMNLMVDTTTTLTALFGDLGDSIGKSGEALVKFAQDNEKFLLRKKTLEGDLIKAKLANDPKQELAISKQIAKVETDSAIANAKNTAALAGATKKLLSEKTLGYKTMAAVEKSTHLTTLALQAEELTVKLSAWAAEVSAKVAAETAKTGISQTGFLTRLPTYISEIWASWGAMGPWGAAAAGLFIAAKLSGGGGKDSYSGPTGEEFQKAQGTGQMYSKDAAGKNILVDTGTGVFGDSTQKLDSINMSLELISATTVKGLAYDSKMLAALNKFADAITGATTKVYSVAGLRQGTGFGTLEGSTSKRDRNIGDLFSIGLPGTNKLVGNMFAKVFGGGTSITTSIDAAGIQLTGSFQNIIDDVSGSIVQYKDILNQFHKSGGWFGSDSNWTTRTRETQALDKQVSGAIADIFVNAKDMFTSISEYSGVSAQQVDMAFKNMSASIDINLKGLTGDEVLKELNATVSSKLNELSARLFAAFDQYKKFGEDLLTTVIRVTDTNAKINQIMLNLGSSSPSLKGIFNITEALAKAAGGLDKFVTQANYFSENFYTSAEQAIPTQKALIKQLDAMGLSGVDTKAKLRALVQSLDLTTSKGQKTYQQLMDLAPGFVEVTDAISAQSTALSEAATNFRDFAKTIKEFRDGLVLSASSTATPMEKYVEAKSQFESTYAAALSGDKTAMDKLTSISQTFLDASKQAYASSAKYTTDFNTVLSKLGDASISASASASVAELQLNNLSIHTTLLTSINKNIATIAGVPAKASGGRVSGLTLVGEMGPELVDFTTPGNVYTAEQTAGMFTGTNMNAAVGAMVLEIQQLRQEVSLLRKDQQKQTGDLIISNYGAAQKASEDIVVAVTVASKDAAWNDRSKSEIR